MTILQSLDRYYDRMAARGEAEAPGFSREKIGFAIVLSPEGEPVDVADLRVQSGKKLIPQLMEVPAAVKRTAGILSNRFWDKSAYVLGQTAGEGRRTADEHAAFKALHLDLLAGSTDEGLVALRRFLETWDPARFDTAPFVPEMLDANIVFRLDDGANEMIHEREAALRMLAAGPTEGNAEICLVTGMSAPTQRLHPTIKGIQGAQSSGAALVSFNLDAFTSYGKEQGANAPVSEAAAFRYGAALNRMLDRDSPNRLQRTVGDATVVFWADASKINGSRTEKEEAAAAAEHQFRLQVDPPIDANLEKDAQEAAKIRDELEKVAAGRPEDANPKLRKGTRFHVLGLAPNAARLSVRYWLEDDFERFAARLLEHARDVAIEPRPRGWGQKQPSVQRLLLKTTALQEKFDNIPDQLAGEVMRAVLTGTRYPRTLLNAAIIRLRAGDAPWTGWHAAVIRACLNRPLEQRLEVLRRNGAEAAAQQIEKEILPVPLDPNHKSPAYQLGRLFAVLESAQYAALGRVNAPIGDRYYGAASSTPARVFGALFRGLKTHISDARKRGQGGWIEPKVTEILSRLPPDLPKTLRVEDQGKFAVGYYHERSTRKPSDAQLESSGEGKADDN